MLQRGFKSLQSFTGVYKGLQTVKKGGYEELQGCTKGYKGLQSVTKGYKKF